MPLAQHHRGKGRKQSGINAFRLQLMPHQSNFNKNKSVAAQTGHSSRGKKKKVLPHHDWQPDECGELLRKHVKMNSQGYLKVLGRHVATKGHGGIIKRTAVAICRTYGDPDIN